MLSGVRLSCRKSLSYFVVISFLETKLLFQAKRKEKEEENKTNCIKTSAREREKRKQQVGESISVNRSR